MAEYGSDYAVGYGRPPLHSRFRKGRSGNPYGRARRPNDLAVLVKKALDRPAGSRPRRRRLTQRETIVARLIERAAEGDLRATRLLIDFVERYAEEMAPEPDLDDVESARERLIHELDKISAEVEAEAAKERQEELMIYDEALWLQPASAGGTRERL